MMYRSTHPSGTESSGGVTRSRIRRSIALLAASAALALPIASSHAQAVPAIEVRPLAGVYMPFGRQADNVEQATMFGGQASWLLSPTWALTGSLGFTRSQDRLTPVPQDLNMLQYDAGIEARVVPSIGMDWTLAPFIGLGAAARTYSYKNIDVDNKTFGGGYAALGAELAYRSLGLRVEARDYVSRFKPMTPGSSQDWEYRNDMTLSAGLNLRIW